MGSVMENPERVSLLERAEENLRFNRGIRHVFYAAQAVLRKKQWLQNAEKAIDKAGLPVEQYGGKAKILQDMLDMYRRYGYKAGEYIGFAFYDKDLEERLCFVADWERYGYTMAMNRLENARYFQYKHLTYQKFQPFFQRKVFLCTKETTFEEFRAFLDTLPGDRFVTKPDDSSAGIGFRINSLDCTREDFEELRKSYGGVFLAEELIRQAEATRKLNPESVNTCRVTTIRFDDETLIVHPRLRVGRRGMQVDNAAAGGIICLLNPGTGEIIAAADEAGNHYDIHPDSGERLVGEHLARWQEAKDLVLKLAQVIPDNRYTGWDIALTDEGWIMVEGNNRAQFGWQYAEQKGCRQEITSYLQRLGKNY